MIYALPMRFGNGVYRQAYQIPEDYFVMLKECGVNIYPVADKALAIKAAEFCDGLLMIGGEDLNPALYQEEVNGTGEFHDEIDELDYALIEAFTALKKPILGICRGQQILNVYFKGSLYQDIQNHNETKHQVSVAKDSFLYHTYQKETLEVNSFHHQNVKEVAPGFKVAAICADGYVEAIEKDNICAVQWHPEMYDGKRFFEGFVSYVKQKS